MALREAGGEVGSWSADRSTVQATLLGSSSGLEILCGRPENALLSFGRPDILHDNGIWLPHNHKLAALASGREYAGYA